MNASLPVCALAVVLTPALTHAATCESLTSLTLPGASITSAVAVPAGGLPATNTRGAAALANLPAFCRVAATLRPTADSDIKMEIWLPDASAWNGKYEANGNGGWTGSISATALANGLRRGYAASMSDLGHEGSSAEFAVGHPEKLIDYGYRAAHETTVASKAIIAAFYTRAPKYSYWTGCSAGGRSAMMEAQRYPDDFDGIVAGAPGLNWTGRATQAMWIEQAAHKDEASYIPPSKYPVVHEAVLAACDAKDGAKDGVLEDPTRCKFDPQELLCKGADDGKCLTAPQVETARAIYAAVINPRTKQVFSPGSERGSELGWATMAGPRPFTIGWDYFRYVVFHDPDWKPGHLNFDSDMQRAAVNDHTLNAMDPNLRQFLSHGKLIQYHGWSDPQIAPSNSTRYYESVVQEMGGPDKINGAYRLFMIPGMAHCGGGEGVSNFDMIAALEQWVEAGKAPDQIPASRIRNGKVERTRPLCPYPQLATWKGNGSIDDAANFTCK
ncbi:MAG TPA: tannase/feruloyl esterase family alpha/beta hydrolase [Bryobacteraceae bacterium]|nr:tannase/feruloyl esterase family alpha/beta hydrolase [Bryobacteraceae bacterium]